VELPSRVEYRSCDFISLDEINSDLKTEYLSVDGVADVGKRGDTPNVGGATDTKGLISEVGGAILKVGGVTDEAVVP
jgi:hypothetical protein